MEASQIQHGEPRRLVMSAPTPLRQDFDVSQLRSLARRTKDGPQARRLLALAAIYDGATRTEAAKIGGVGLQIILAWPAHAPEARATTVARAPAPQTAMAPRSSRQCARRTAGGVHAGSASAPVSTSSTVRRRNFPWD